MPFNVDEFIERLSNCKSLKEDEIEILCSRVSDILAREPNIIKLKAPITICGNIHGQFKDLLKIFKLGGPCAEINYLFLGNYSNRGYDTIETVSLLFSLKLRYPDRITLLRGNHDSANISQVHGFYDESVSKYQSPIVWSNIAMAFNYLPIAAVINDKIFCVSGGLSPDLTLLEDMDPLQRVSDIPPTGIICDIMWSDPDDILGWQLSPRGAGYLFGEDVTKQFMRTNNLNLIVRAHQFCIQGYKKMFGGTVVTVWSAPNYCYTAGNLASILELGENLSENYKVFAATDQSPCTMDR